MDTQDDIAGLRDPNKTIDEAAEVIAAFISASAGRELPQPELADVANKTVDELVEWRETLKELFRRADGGAARH